MHVFCCYSEGLTEGTDSFTIYKGPSEGKRDRPVTLMENQINIRKIVFDLCCKKHGEIE